jgi:hypothetical protein
MGHDQCAIEKRDMSDISSLKSVIMKYSTASGQSSQDDVFHSLVCFHAGRPRQRVTRRMQLTAAECSMLDALALMVCCGTMVSFTD